MEDLSCYLVKIDEDLQQAVKRIDSNRNGIALVVDHEGRLAGTITDGDVRRCMLQGKGFEALCRDIMNTDPTTAGVEAGQEEILALMKARRIQNVPVLDPEGRPLRVVHMRRLLGAENGRTIAVVMAGGEGKRLRPITEKIPKPMVRVKGRPILEHIVEKLIDSDITTIYLAVNYKAEIIKDHFQDGADFGAEIKYLHEDSKLGTIGALSLLPELPVRPLLVMNGDVITEVNFHSLLDFHRHHRAALSVAVTEYHITVPFGVLELAGHFVVGMEEKPSKRYLCNAGIYALDPEVVSMVPSETYYDLPDLMRSVVDSGLPVAAFPIHEYWVDIGRKDDLMRARHDGEDTAEAEGTEQGNES